MHREHDHHTHPAGATGGVGHNQPAPRTVQWQRPHVVGGEAQLDEAPTCEPDLDLVEAAFSEGFAIARDPTSFLRLAQVPFEALSADGERLVLLRVEIDAVADVGGVTPHLGGGSFRYDPLPAQMVSNRRRLRFVYFDGHSPRALKLSEVRALKAAAAP
jgi:hypothetical protein